MNLASTYHDPSGSRFSPVIFLGRAYGTFDAIFMLAVIHPEYNPLEESRSLYSWESKQFVVLKEAPSTPVDTQAVQGQDLSSKPSVRLAAGGLIAVFELGEIPV